jgi:hypothetical protein
MTQDRRTRTALAALLPAGTLGLSIGLAAADARATASDPQARKPGAIHERLDSIRRSVSGIVNETPADAEPFVRLDPDKRLAWWGNGWHNGGWRNWGNGWNNGWSNILPILPFNNWGNGGWHNWGNGWHNGWHNW